MVTTIRNVKLTVKSACFSFFFLVALGMSVGQRMEAGDDNKSFGPATSRVDDFRAQTRSGGNTLLQTARYCITCICFCNDVQRRVISLNAGNMLCQCQ